LRISKGRAKPLGLSVDVVVEAIVLGFGRGAGGMTLRDFVIFWAGIVVGSGIAGGLAMMTIDRMYRDNQRLTVKNLRGEAD
jgi:hypothetical protein